MAGQDPAECALCLFFFAVIFGGYMAQGYLAGYAYRRRIESLATDAVRKASEEAHREIEERRRKEK